MGTLPQHSEYPVVNISHESAVAFCAWLTEVYRTFPNRKYKNATFKLPTEQEWEAAARGGHKQTVYPWGGPYLCNTRGCYLCNFNPQEMRFLKRAPDGEEYYDYPAGDITISRGLDGREMLGLATDYNPNDYGLYQCAGNAAEMIDEPGVSKGGSWTSTAYYIQISSRDEYSKPNPSLGFRVFMEVDAQAEASR
jgi:formylglycine-generating enzyme required for sulfatase activity